MTGTRATGYTYPFADVPAGYAFWSPTRISAAEYADAAVYAEPQITRITRGEARFTPDPQVVMLTGARPQKRWGVAKR